MFSNLKEIIFSLSLITLACSFPIDDDESARSADNSNNDFFKQINEILKRDIEHSIGDKSVEVGDKFSSKDKDGQIQISVQKFSFGVNKFPVTFQPEHDKLLEDVTIIPIGGDFDESGTFEIKNESAEITSKTQLKDESALIKTVENSSKALSADQKLVKDAEQQPILTTV